MVEINDAIQKSDDTNVKAAQTSSLGAVDIVNSNFNWLNKKQPSIKTWLIKTYGNEQTDGAASISATAILLIVPVLVAFTFVQ